MDSTALLSAIEPLLDESLASWQNDLSDLIAEVSVRDLQTAGPGAPFGQGIKAAMDTFVRIAENLGFSCVSDEGYAVDARLPGLNELASDYVAVLGHLDVVPADERDWETPAFSMYEEGGYVYGRGVNDDKGPLLLCLHAAALLKKVGFEFQFPLRIIAGGAEESTWECVTHYFQRNIQPLAAFSPDGNFPIINHELGILDISLSFPSLAQTSKLQSIRSAEAAHRVCSELQISYLDSATQKYTQKKIEGLTALSRHPARGVNALDKLMQWLVEEGFEQSLNEVAALRFYQQYLLAEPGKVSRALVPLFTDSSSDEALALFTQTATAFSLDDKVGVLHLDIRYPQGYSSEQFLSKLNKILEGYGASLRIERNIEPLYVASDSPLIRALSRSYERVMIEPIGQPEAKGAASYARALNNAVNFGPTFQGENPGTHLANEHFSLRSARQLLKIYALSIAALSRGEGHLLP